MTIIVRMGFRVPLRAIAEMTKRIKRALSRGLGHGLIVGQQM